jgi:hypothetical protein
VAGWLSPSPSLLLGRTIIIKRTLTHELRPSVCDPDRIVKVVGATESVIYVVKHQTRCAREKLLIFSVVSVILLVSSVVALAQDAVTRTATVGSGVEGRTYKEIPAASEPCSPEECAWWNRLRMAGNTLLRKSDEKSKAEYVAVFLEGIEKSYRVPVKDRPSQTLVFPLRIRTDDLPFKERNGQVKLSLEVRPDASIAEIKVLEGIGTKINERCIKAAQNMIFLPAIKNGSFVSDIQTRTYSFFRSPLSR